MRKLFPLLLLVLAVSAMGQSKDQASSVPGSASFLESSSWSSLGRPVEGIRGYSLFTRNMQPRTDSLFEVWIRIVPTNAAAFNRRYGLPRESSYVIQHATVDCSKRTVMLEKTAAYSGSNAPVDAKASDLVKGEQRARVKAGSVADTVFQYICVKLQ